MKRENGTVHATPPQHRGNAADLECLRRIAAGDAGSIGELYDRHATAIYSLALRILDRDEDAADVAHEVFVEASRRAGRDEGSQGVVSTWLLMLTKTMAIDRLRSVRAGSELRRTVDGTRLSGTTPAKHDSADETPKFNASERVRDALHALPVLHRMAIEMTYFEGLSQHEVARCLEQPLGAVTTRIRLALLKLRSALTGDVR